MAEQIRCRYCKKIVGVMFKTGRENHGIPEFGCRYNHATMKDLHPYPNKMITVRDRICDYCGKPVT
jgi:hypothetical protein